MNGYYRKLEILKNYNNLCKHIDDLACDYGELFTRATRIAQQLRDDVSPANHDNQSKVEGYTVKLAAKKAELERQITKRNVIDTELKKLGVKNEYIVRKICIEGQKVIKVSRDLKMNYTYVVDLRRKLVNKLKI